MKQPEKPCSILEAILWAGSFQIAQGIVLVVFVALLLTASFGWNWPGEADRVELALELNLDRSFLLIGVSTLGAVFIILPLIRLRLGKNYRSLIGWRCPRHEELIFAVATVIPIAVLGDMLFECTRSLLNSSPLHRLFSEAFDLTSLDFIRSSLNGVPYPVLVVALALGPAFGEELVFRGVIGRGLVARCGPWTGSAITVVLFAMAHMSPAHALATVPIAILLQFLYLKTSTIWIPILVHFCNNLLAVSMMRFRFVPDLQVSPQTGLIFFCYLIVLLTAFESRRRDWSTA